MMHAFFTCPFARACWYGSTVAVRADAMPDSIQSTLMGAAQMLSDEQWDQFTAVMWSIWRCRNDLTYGGTKPTLQTFHKYVQAISSETLLAKSKVGRSSGEAVQTTPQGEDAIICMTDGSWTKDWLGGIGFILCRGSTLLAYKSTGVRACTPIQVEAMALKVALCYVQQQGLIGCKFLTDNKNLADICQSNSCPMQADWSAYSEIFEVWKTFRARRDFSCCHVARSQIPLADYLAKKGRVERWDHLGFSYPFFKI